jgi:hypothetical protein
LVASTTAERYTHFLCQPACIASPLQMQMNDSQHIEEKSAKLNSFGLSLNENSGCVE